MKETFPAITEGTPLFLGIEWGPWAEVEPNESLFRRQLWTWMSVVFTLQEQGDLILEFLLHLLGDVILYFITSNTLPQRRQWHPTPVLLPGKYHGQGAWWAARGVAKIRHDWATSLSLFTFMHWRRKWQPTPVFLPGESQGRGSRGALWAAVYGVVQSQTRLKQLSSSNTLLRTGEKMPTKVWHNTCLLKCLSYSFLTSSLGLRHRSLSYIVLVYILKRKIWVK